MLNSVARYLWGSSSEADQDVTSPAQGQSGSGGDQARQLDPAAVNAAATTCEAAGQNDVAVTTHPCDDDDWVVVGLAKQSGDSDRLGLGDSTASTAAAASGDTAATSLAESRSEDVSRVMGLPHTGARGRGSRLVHLGESATPQQLARIERAAQQLQQCTAQKEITAQRCDRQNKARDFASHPRVKTNNKRNKHMNASGAKSSRISQRM